MVSPPWTSGAPPERSAAGYRARADLLIKAAAEAETSAAALHLEGLAHEWRKLAIEADWQDAMLAALKRLDLPLPNDVAEP